MYFQSLVGLNKLEEVFYTPDTDKIEKFLDIAYKFWIKGAALFGFAEYQFLENGQKGAVIVLSRVSLFQGGARMSDSLL